MKALRWADAAKTDLLAIADYYDAIDPRIGQRMLASIVDAPRLLRERPLIGPSVGLHGLRKWSVRRTPFVLLYRVTPTEIEVARVLHAAQNWTSE